MKKRVLIIFFILILGIFSYTPPAYSQLIFSSRSTIFKFIAPPIQKVLEEMLSSKGTQIFEPAMVEKLLLTLSLTTSGGLCGNLGNGTIFELTKGLIHPEFKDITIAPELTGINLSEAREYHLRTLEEIYHDIEGSEGFHLVILRNTKFINNDANAKLKIKLKELIDEYGFVESPEDLILRLKNSALAQEIINQQEILLTWEVAKRAPIVFSDLSGSDYSNEKIIVRFLANIIDHFNFLTKTTSSSDIPYFKDRLSLKQISTFLREVFGKSVKIPDIKYMTSVSEDFKLLEALVWAYYEKLLKLNSQDANQLLFTLFQVMERYKIRISLIDENALPYPAEYLEYNPTEAVQSIKIMDTVKRQFEISSLWADDLRIFPPNGINHLHIKP